MGLQLARFARRVLPIRRRLHADHAVALGTGQDQADRLGFGNPKKRLAGLALNVERRHAKDSGQAGLAEETSGPPVDDCVAATGTIQL